MTTAKKPRAPNLGLPRPLSPLRPTQAPAPAKRPPAGRWRPLLRRAWIGLFMLLVALPLALTALYRFLPPPATPLMLIRLAEGHGLSKDWLPLTAMSPHVANSVIAAEDNLFCTHLGFDWQAIGEEIETLAAGGRPRGASTISMQTAKNLFLWPGRDPIRKALEVPYTFMIEALWPKRRIIEVYLNVAEFGPGIYGVAAAARAHFGKEAADLTVRESALLAAVLPNPLAWSAARPTDYIAGRASNLRTRVRQLGPMLDCAG